MRYSYRVLLFGLLLGLLFGFGSLQSARGQGPQPEATQTLAPVVMVALPWDDPSIRIPPPRNFRRNPEFATSTFTINYLTAGTPDGFGATCLDWDPAAQTAFSYAASIWASTLNSNVPIRINACWANLGDTGTLGYSASNAVVNVPGGQSGTIYNYALADKIYGADLYPSSPDSYITYNSNYSWYFGTDGNTPSGQYDLVSVALHEMGHSINFSGRMRYGATSCTDATYGCWATATYPGIFDRFVENGAGQSILDTGLFPSPSAALGSQLTGGDLYFDGPNANAANGGNRVKIYAPGTWLSGSSYSHLDYATFAGTANRLMVYAISSASSIHDPGPVSRGILQDVGWGKMLQSISVSTHAPASAEADTTFTVAANATSGLSVSYSASGGCTNEGALFTMTSSTSDCVVQYSQAGNSNYNAATNVSETVSAVCHNTMGVSNTNDGGAGSLRQAALRACADGTVNFDSGLAGQTISHAAALTFDKNITLDDAGLSSPVTFGFTDLAINNGVTVYIHANNLNVSGTFTNDGILKNHTLSQTLTSASGAANFTDATGTRTMQLTSTGGTDLGETTITATQNQSPPACGTRTFTGSMVRRHFDISPANASGVAGTATFYFAPGELNGLNANALVVYHCNGSAWQELGGTYTRGTDGSSGYYYVTLPGISSFSPFALGPANAPTNALLTSFHAAQKNSAVRVRWQTGSELNLVGLNVWRKTGKGEWVRLNADPLAPKNGGTLAGAKYSYADKTVKVGKTYRYRVELLTTQASVWSETVRVKVK